MSHHLKSGAGLDEVEVEEKDGKAKAKEQESSGPKTPAQLAAALTEWATASCGIHMHDGIAPVWNADGSGMGIAAIKSIPYGTTLMSIPARSLLTLDSPLQCSLDVAARLPPKTTTHARLAAVLTIQEAEAATARTAAGAATSKDGKDVQSTLNYEPWRATWPSIHDFEACVPLAAPESLSTGLSVGARQLLKAQQEKFAADWAAMRPFLSDVPIGVGADKRQEGGVEEEAMQRAYLRNWLVVNTRSFYWDYERVFLSASSDSTITTTISNGKSSVRSNNNSTYRKKTGPLNPDEQMALVPLADYFNHTSEADGCEVDISARGIRVRAARAYEKGDDVRFCYGPHSNDALVVEYGFRLADNRFG